MKAAVYYENGTPEVFKYEEVPDPVCHPKGVVIRVEAVSIEGETRLTDGVDRCWQSHTSLVTRPAARSSRLAPRSTIFVSGRRSRPFSILDRTRRCAPFPPATHGRCRRVSISN